MLNYFENFLIAAQTTVPTIPAIEIDKTIFGVVKNILNKIIILIVKEKTR